MIPEEEIHQQKSINLTPMVDFLFLILVIFAVMAVTRTMLDDSDVKIVQMDSKGSSGSMASTSHSVLLSIDDEGHYKWITEFNEYVLDGIQAIIAQLQKQQDLGLLPQENDKIKILLQIDRSAQWQHVAKAILALKESGFSISPVYTHEES